MTTDPKEAAEILTGIYVSTEYTQTDVAEFLTDFAAAVRAEQREEDAVKSGLAFEAAKRREEIVDAALTLLVFAKNHEYPKENTTEFFELTELVDKLETAFEHNGISAAIRKGKP